MTFARVSQNGGGGGNRKRRTCEPRERFKDARKKSVNNKRASLIRNLEPSRETSVCLSWGDTSRVKQPAVIARKNSQGDLKSCVALRCVALLASVPTCKDKRVEGLGSLWSRRDYSSDLNPN